MVLVQSEGNGLKLRVGFRFELLKCPETEVVADPADIVEALAVLHVQYFSQQISHLKNRDSVAGALKEFFGGVEPQNVLSDHLHLGKLGSALFF